MKKFLSMIMCVLMVVSFMPTTAFADEPVAVADDGISENKSDTLASDEQAMDGKQGTEVGQSDGEQTDGQTVEDQEAIENESTETPVGNTTLDSVIDAFISNANENNHTFNLPEGIAWPEGTPVYWKAGGQSGFAATLANALTAAYQANTSAGDIIIVCQPGADVGSMTHGHVEDNITIYGNNAYLSGGECDLEVDTYMFSRSTGAKVNDGSYLSRDIKITAYELDNLGAWGERHTAYTIDISLIDCDGKALNKNVQRVYITGKTGTNNITLKDCDIITAACPMYSNANGTILIEDCTFTNVAEPINLKHKSAGQANYTVKNCTFTNCGSVADNDKTYAAPIRLVSESGSDDSPINAIVENCTFSETVGINGDILVGDGRANETCDYEINLSVNNAGSKTAVMMQKSNYYSIDKSVANSANAKTINVAAGESLTTSWSDAFVVAKIGERKYASIESAISAVATNQTIQLVDDVTLNGRLTIQVNKTFTIDLGGHTLTGRTDIRQGNVTIKNGTVTNTTQPLNVYGSTEASATDYSILTISKDVDVSATENVVCMMNAEGVKTYGAVINIAGNIKATGSGNDAAVFVSGNIGNSDSEVDIDAMNKNNIINITGKIAGGKIVAMAMNGQATVNVKSSASISGATGINVKRGTLNVEGGTIQGKGDKVDPVTANTNGAENTGAGVSVTSTYNYAGLIDINITGGTIVSDNNVAFYIGHSKKDGTSVAFKKGVSTKLAGGNFVGAKDSDAVYVADRISDDANTYTKEIVSGGTYSSDPSAYCTSDVLFIAGTNLQKTGSLASVGAISAKTWKLTVRDISKAITTGTATYVSGQALVSVPVTVSGSGLDQVSVVITSGEAPSGSNILYYGKLDGVDTSAIGRQTGTLTLPKDLPDGYKVYLLAEDINTNTATGTVTDYASEPVELTLTATTEKDATSEDGTVTKTITVGEKTIVETTTTTAIKKEGNTTTTVENKTVEDKVNNTKTTATVTKTSTGSGITSTTTNKTVTKLDESGNETNEKEEITTKVTETANQKITEETKTVVDSSGKKTGEEKTETTVTTQNNKTETTEVKTVTAGALATKTETKKVEANNITTTEKTVTKTSNGGNPVVVATKTVEDTANDVAVETVVEGETAKVEAKIAENLTSSGSEGAAEAPATITVDATAAESVEEKVKAAEVTLPATTVTALKEVAKQTSGSTAKVETVELKTNVATLQINNKALQTLTDGADETKPLVLTVEKKETSPQQSEGSAETGSTSGNVKATFELTAKIGGEDAFKEKSEGSNSNGTITINVSYKPTSSSNKIEVYYVNGSIRKPMGATYNKSTGVLSWGTNHFSTFEVEESASQGGGSSYDSGSIDGGGSSSGAAGADETKDNAEDTEDAKAIEEKASKAEAKELVKKITNKPSVSQTKQGNIKVTFQVNEKKIQAFKDLGYTVKYKFYRSTKKSSGYKAKAEKAKKTYTDKTGKKGTKYYYKVRVMVYDAQGKVVAKTSLKQCKYVASVK